MTDHPIDNHVTYYLRRLAAKDEALPTAAEIAEGAGMSVSQARTSLRRLVAAGEVRTVGVASSGAKTWALTSDLRLHDADREQNREMRESMNADGEL